MEKFIPYEKRSKKEKRKIDNARRSSWGSLNPVTRKPISSKAYNRKKAQNWKRNIPNSVPYFFARSTSSLPHAHLMLIMISPGTGLCENIPTGPVGM